MLIKSPEWQLCVPNLSLSFSLADGSVPAGSQGKSALSVIQFVSPQEMEEKLITV